MKTPIQEIIQILKGTENEINTNANFIEVLKKYLPKERDHIEDAYNLGLRNKEDSLPTGDKYFIEKYKK